MLEKSFAVLESFPVVRVSCCEYLAPPSFVLPLRRWIKRVLCVMFCRGSDLSDMCFGVEREPLEDSLPERVRATSFLRKPVVPSFACLVYMTRFLGV